MDEEWYVLLSSDDLNFVQKMHRYFDLFRDMNAEWSQKVFPLRSHYIENPHSFNAPASAQYLYLGFYGCFESIKNAADYLKEYSCIVCYDTYKHLDELAELCLKLDLNHLYVFSDPKNAEYFAELMVVQYACDQLIGIDYADIRDCLASDSKTMRMLNRKSINSYEGQFENVHRALLYAKSNYKGLYDFSLFFEETYKLLPNIKDCLFMAFFNNPLFIEEQGIIYVESEIQCT